MGRQYGMYLPFAAVGFGVGIGAFFSQPILPSIEMVGMAASVAVGFMGACVRFPSARAPIWAFLIAPILGFCAAWVRVVLVAAPVLGWPYYGYVEGDIVTIDKSASNKPRVLLENLIMSPISSARTPRYIRIFFHGDGVDNLIPGRRIGARAYVTPPSGPAEPYGFDFRRYLWFYAIGGVGYSRDPPQDLGPAVDQFHLSQLRSVLAHRIGAHLDQPARGLAVAMFLGDLSHLDPKVVDDLRATNLAHLLAISGLHMGLLCGLVFACLRVAFILCAGIAKAGVYKKYAAVIVCFVGGFYWALSGGSIATTRAFIMALIVFGAVILDRRALTLRAVAVAAFIILTIWPESLTSPGFQMSFAATIALVVCYRGYAAYGVGRGLPKGLKWLVGVAFSSLIAGAATSPFSAAHFNHLSSYGILANLASVPVVGALSMPAGVLMFLLMPFGVEGIPAQIVQHSLDWVAFVAANIAVWPGSGFNVVMPSPMVLPLLSFGLIWLILWQGILRWMGGGAVLVAISLWMGSGRPAVLIEENACLVGVMTDQGRAISRAHGAGFVARIWLENDADDATQELSHARAPSDPWRMPLGRGSIIHARRADGVTCAAQDILVLQAPTDTPFGCEVLTPNSLRTTGSLALYHTSNGLQRIAARDYSGRWPWSDPQVRNDVLQLKSRILPVKPSG